ncbi:hypothetical protein BU15DRAFT_83383 [Melanogaster broomeanus]|nr:hypothetical protein BU15DRAFT_83383 [Melanogaster broomeanus]
MESPPVTEIVRFTPTESYLANAGEALQSFFEILASTEGFISAYHGLQLDDPGPEGKRGFIIILWETLEHHVALQNDNDKYSMLKASISGAADNRRMFHVFPKSDPSSGLTADALEIASLTLKAGHTTGDISEGMDELVSQKTPGIVGSPTWGRVHEEKETVVIFVGWSSREVGKHLPAIYSPACYLIPDTLQMHMNAVNSPTEAISGAFRKINEHMDGIDVKHTKLEKYSLPVDAMA